jgi:hypothetical protein
MKSKPIDQSLHAAYLRTDSLFIEEHAGDTSGTTAATIVIDHHNKVRYTASFYCLIPHTN